MESVPRALYPERASEGIESKIKRLALIDQNKETVPLADSEREEILSAEMSWGKRLEKIDKITPRSVSLECSYLLTDEGRSDFERVFGETLPECETITELVEYLYTHQTLLETADSKERAKFSGRSQTYYERQVHIKLEESTEDDGRLHVTGIEPPQLVLIQFTPELLVQKIESLRIFKQELKQLGVEYSQVKESHTRSAYLDIIKLYIKKINFEIASLVQSGLSVQSKQALSISLSDDEDRLLKESYLGDGTDRFASRLDKFRHGASKEYTDAGYHPQISTELKAYAEQVDSRWQQSVLNKENMIRATGYDPEKLSEKIFTSEMIEEYAQDVLKEYDFLSAYPATDYYPDRSGPAPDGKWQVIVSDADRVMSVNSKQKVVKIPKKNQSATTLFSITLAHEIEGHVLQHENKEQIGLRLYERVGSERSSIFAEGGAMQNQNHVAESAFGYNSPSYAHYIRAMLTKLQGGTYGDCVNTFYESAIAPFRKMWHEGTLDYESFRKKSKNSLPTAINRARRLFRGGGSYTSGTVFLTNSQATAYLEQLKLSDELSRNNLDHYLYLSGVNLDAILTLRELGFLDPDDIQVPKHVAVKKWQEISANFALTA